MGYALGGYVAIPNFGLFLESSIPAATQPRHSLVSTLPLISYIALMVVFGVVISTPIVRNQTENKPISGR